MAAEHAIASRRAKASERLEAVRSRLSQMLELSDVADDDAPGVVKRDRAAFELYKTENLIEFLEGAVTRVNAMQSQIAEKDAQIAALSAPDGDKKTKK